MTTDSDRQATPLRLSLIEKLNRLHPDTTPMLTFASSFELLIAVILSAQCTDAKVNEVTPVLFRAFPTPEALANAPLAVVEKIVYSTGFYREKAAHLIGTARILHDQYADEVPLGMDQLTSLPGVGRKTANVVRGQIGGLPAVIVDTHFKRVTRRLGFTEETDPLKIERDLLAWIPEPQQYPFSMSANRHGRAYCHARNPRCGDCPVHKLCPSG
ncbi:MAG: endonuclease III [Spirochaetales bacterium]